MTPPNEMSQEDLALLESLFSPVEEQPLTEDAKIAYLRKMRQESQRPTDFLASLAKVGQQPGRLLRERLDAKLRMLANAAALRNNVRHEVRTTPSYKSIQDTGELLSPADLEAKNIDYVPEFNHVKPEEHRNFVFGHDRSVEPDLVFRSQSNPGVLLRGSQVNASGAIDDLRMQSPIDTKKASALAVVPYVGEHGSESPKIPEIQSSEWRPVAEAAERDPLAAAFKAAFKKRGLLSAAGIAGAGLALPALASAAESASEGDYPMAAAHVANLASPVPMASLLATARKPTWANAENTAKASASGLGMLLGGLPGAVAGGVAGEAVGGMLDQADQRWPSPEEAELGSQSEFIQSLRDPKSRKKRLMDQLLRQRGGE